MNAGAAPAVPSAVGDASAAVARTAVEQVASDATAGSIDDFASHLAVAAALVKQLRDVKEQQRLSAIVRAFDDLLVVWQYWLSDPAGGFFDDQSSAGMFSRLVRDYPEYRAFIEPFAIRANRGRILYPTAETRRFLIEVARAQLAPGRSPRPESSIATKGAPPTVSIPSERSVSTNKTPAAVSPATDARIQTNRVQPERVATPTAAMSPIANVDGSCASLTKLQNLELTPTGLVISAASPVTARITRTQQIGDAGFAGFTLVTVEVPFADPGTTPSRLTSEQGPFSSLRAVRYQSSGECGVRIRLEAREQGPWIVETSGNTISVSRPRTPVLTTGERAEVAAQQRGQSGSIHVGGTSFAASNGANAGGQAQIGFATDAGAGTTLRGFFSAVAPRSIGGGPYGALSLSGFEILGRPAEIGLGDLAVSMSGESVSSASQLTIRGLAGAIYVSPRSALQIFGGRAALSSLRRIFEDQQTSDISSDRVVGVTQRWLPTATNSGFSFGWAHSLPRQGRSSDDLLQSFQFRANRAYDVRFTAEESVSRETDRTLFGYAWTVEPRAVMKKLSINGFYRYTSPDFHPPLASSFYAGLRRSYNLTGSYTPTERLTVGASLGQTKSFSVFDPEASGTVASSIASSVSYRLTRRLSASATYAESGMRSDPGVLVETNSDTRGTGGGLFFSSGRGGVGLSLSQNRTVDRANDALDFNSTRLDLNASYGRNDLQFLGRFHVGHAERATGAAAGAEYGGALGVQSSRTSGALRAETGFSATPSGVAAQPVRQFYASLAYTPASQFRLFQGSAQLTYQSVQVNGEPARNALLVSLTAGRLFEWGRASRPLAPYETRALQVGQTLLQPLSGHVDLYVFEDRNDNGSRDPDEPLLPGISLHLDERRVTTGSSGLASVLVPPGIHHLRLGAGLITQSYVAIRPLPRIEVGAGQHKSAAIPLVPAGRLVIRVLFTGQGESDALLSGIRVVAHGEHTTREQVTTGAGDMAFGLLPVGDYTVSVDPKTLAPETRLATPASFSVKITHGQRSVLTFRIRRATLRERFGAST